MACRPAPACSNALREATFIWPDRSKLSDGTCASSQHSQQNPNSDHEPNSDGYATAFDLTDDKLHGCDADWLAEQIRLRRDERIKYVISERRMFSSYRTSTHPAWTWRPYSGPNPHSKHVHFSILPEFIHDQRQWWYPLLTGELMRYPADGYLEVTIGSNGKGGESVPVPFDRIVSVQEVAGANGELVGIDTGFRVDPGDTQRSIVEVQKVGMGDFSVGVVVGYV